MPKQKDILLMVRWSIAIYGFRVALDDSWVVLWKNRGGWWNSLHASIWAVTSGKIRKGREWDQEGMLLQNLTLPLSHVPQLLWQSCHRDQWWKKVSELLVSIGRLIVKDWLMITMCHKIVRRKECFVGHWFCVWQF